MAAAKNRWVGLLGAPVTLTWWLAHHSGMLVVAPGALTGPEAPRSGPSEDAYTALGCFLSTGRTGPDGGATFCQPRRAVQYVCMYVCTICMYVHMSQISTATRQQTKVHFGGATAGRLL